MADEFYIKIDNISAKEDEPKHNVNLYIFIIIIIIGLVGFGYLYFFTHLSGFTVQVVEPVGDIPAYHVINNSDVTIGYIRSLYLAGNISQNTSDVIGKYSFVELYQGKPISLDVLGNLSAQTNLTDTVRIGVPLPDDDVTICNDSLGEPVDLYLVNDTGNQMPVIFDNVTVLDVNGFAVDNNSEQYDAIIALPDADITQYMDSISTSNVEIVKNA